MGQKLEVKQYIKVLIFEKFILHQLDTIKEILEFLGFKKDACLTLDDTHHNRSKYPKYPKVALWTNYLRQQHFGNSIKLCMLINAKCGLCSEDCSYCSQSKVSKAEIPEYSMVDRQSIVDGAKKAAATGALNFSIVTSGRGPSDAMVDEVAAAVKEIKAECGIEVCASLGILSSGQAETLAESGLDRYHHNINTSAAYHTSICSTHSYEDRIATVQQVQHAGLSSCCGVIVGMGETGEDVVDMAFSLHALNVDSIPVNFLHPVPGTPFGEKTELTPAYCLKVLAMFRFVCPEQDLRLAGGRQHNLRTLQPLALYPISAMFVGDLLTIGGTAVEDDLQMIADLGLQPIISG